MLNVHPCYMCGQRAVKRLESYRLEFCECCGGNIPEGASKYVMDGNAVPGWKRVGHHPYHCASCAQEDDRDVLADDHRARTRDAKEASAKHAEAGNAERAHDWQRRADELRND